jgi:chromatin assembly factor 1 subunit B
MHIYNISTKDGRFEAHAVGKNTKMTRHHRTSSSHSRPRMQRRESTASDAESVVTSASERIRDELVAPPLSTPSTSQADAPLTPSTSVASTPHTHAAMFPPPSSSSRRSSFSTPASPASSLNLGRTARSPSPMPALPAIRALPPTMASWTSKLYGDESFTNFFRRLTFSPDGGLLLTPAGQFEDPSVIPGLTRLSNGKLDDQPTRGRKGNLSINIHENPNAGQSSCVYVYSRANFARPPIAQLPGHKKPSVAVRFSSVLYELRPGVASPDGTDPKPVVLEKGKEETVSVDLMGPAAGTPMLPDHSPPVPMSPQTAISTNSFRSPIVAPAPVYPGASAVPAPAMPSPALSATDSLRAPTPARSRASTPNPFSVAGTGTSSVFALPYRMLFAVATKDTVTIHDTQQAGPVSLLTKLHYDEFTDLTW